MLHLREKLLSRLSFVKNMKSKRALKFAFFDNDGYITLKIIDKDYFKKIAGSLGLKGKMLKSLMKDKKIEKLH